MPGPATIWKRPSRRITARCHSEAMRTDRARTSSTKAAMTRNTIPIGRLRIVLVIYRSVTVASRPGARNQRWAAEPSRPLPLGALSGTTRGMSGTTQSRPASILEQIALYGVMLLPLLLLHAHGMAEIVIGVIDLCFLARAALTGDWAWLRTRWLWVAGVWWAWLVICSLPIPGTHLGEGGTRSLIQALATARFLILVAAMEHLVLRTPEVRRWIYRLVAASAAWIALNTFIQYIFGRNLIGWPPAGEGVLTGPFGTARAGPPMARMIIPAVLPAVANLLKRRSGRATAGAYALLLGSVVVMVLIGQRMPLVLTLFGLLIVALLIRWLRPLVLAAAVAGALLLAASPVVAPSALLPAGREVLDADGAFRRFALRPALRAGVGGRREEPDHRHGLRRVRHRLSASGLFPSELRWQPAARRRCDHLLGSSAQPLPAGAG